MRVFLDASCVIPAFERPESNSARIYSHALAGRVEIVVDEEVLCEVQRYFRRRAGRSFAWLVVEQLRRISHLVAAQDCAEELQALGTHLKAADRSHLAACRAAGALYLIALDEDFAPFDEYRTPREAAKLLGLPPAPSQW